MHPTGLRSFTRSIIARTANRDGMTVEAFAQRRWGSESGAFALVSKASVGALTSASAMSAIGAADDEFFASVFEASLLGRMRIREIPFNIRMLRMTTAARGYWVGQSKPIPLSKPVLDGSTLPRRKVAALIVTTRESIEAANPKAEERLEEDLRNALVGAIDEAFIDAGNAGIAGEMPAAVTNGVGVASSGDPAVDVGTLIQNFAGDLTQAVFVTDPLTAAEIGLARDAGGSFQFPDCGPRGGSILNIPVLTTNGSPRTSAGGQLALVDPSRIAGTMEAIEVDQSVNATIEMADDPTGASDTPAAATKTLVSMFQSDSIALRALIHANWEPQGAPVSAVTGASYGVVS